jgi:hypothetical protein
MLILVILLGLQWVDKLDQGVGSLLNNNNNLEVGNMGFNQVVNPGMGIRGIMLVLEEDNNNILDRSRVLFMDIHRVIVPTPTPNNNNSIIHRIVIRSSNNNILGLGLSGSRL